MSALALPIQLGHLSREHRVPGRKRRKELLLGIGGCYFCCLVWFGDFFLATDSNFI